MLLVESTCAFARDYVEHRIYWMCHFDVLFRPTDFHALRRPSVAALRQPHRFLTVS